MEARWGAGVDDAEREGRPGEGQWHPMVLKTTQTHPTPTHQI